MKRGGGVWYGSLFVAGVVCSEKTALEFLEMGLKDSKKLSQKKRFLLEDKIKTHGEVGFFVIKKSANEIDNLELRGVFETRYSRNCRKWLPFS